MNNYARRSYRNAKHRIDVANVSILVVMLVLCILTVFRVGHGMWCAPFIFLCSAAINVLSGVRAFLDEKRVKTVLYGIFAIIALLFFIIALKVYR